MRYLVTAGRIDRSSRCVKGLLPLTLDMPDSYDIVEDSKDNRYEKLLTEFVNHADSEYRVSGSEFRDRTSLIVLAVSPISGGCKCSSGKSGVGSMMKAAEGSSSNTNAFV